MRRSLRPDFTISAGFDAHKDDITLFAIERPVLPRHDEAVMDLAYRVRVEL